MKKIKKIRAPPKMFCLGPLKKAIKQTRRRAGEIWVTIGPKKRLAGSCHLEMVVKSPMTLARRRKGPKR